MVSPPRCPPCLVVSFHSVCSMFILPSDHQLNSLCRCRIRRVVFCALQPLRIACILRIRFPCPDSRRRGSYHSNSDHSVHILRSLRRGVPVRNFPHLTNPSETLIRSADGTGEHSSPEAGVHSGCLLMEYSIGHPAFPWIRSPVSSCTLGTSSSLLSWISWSQVSFNTHFVALDGVSQTGLFLSRYDWVLGVILGRP